MGFTIDFSTSIGKVRLYSGDVEEATAIFQDDAVQTFLNDAGGHIKLAAYYLLTAKIAVLGAVPSSKSMSGYSESYNLANLQQSADRLKADLEQEGVATDGNPVAQFGYAEMARDRHSWVRVELNKALRGESY